MNRQTETQPPNLMKSPHHSSMRIVIALLLICPLIASALGPMRTFTDANGRKILASFVAARGDSVIIQTTDGRQHALKTASLSPADQQYVVTRGGKVGEPPGTTPRPAPPAPAATSSNSTKYGGMALADNWMPQRTETKRELLEGIVFYCKQVLGDTPAGQEKTPSQLSPGITWLMPFDQTLAKLPGRVIKMGERPVNNNCFPANSLTISSFQFKSFQDQGKPFNLIHLLLDLKRQVVGVEFVQQTPGRTEYEIQGKLEPYYNFFNLTNNASTRKEVVYAVLPGGSSGVKCIQTVFRDYANDIGNGLPQIPGIPGAGQPGFPMVNPTTPGATAQFVKVYEIVHWYLAEPFARCLLEIAENSGVRAP
jgi:hypothetical protein